MGNGATFPGFNPKNTIGLRSNKFPSESNISISDHYERDMFAWKKKETCETCIYEDTVFCSKCTRRTGCKANNAMQLTANRCT